MLIWDYCERGLVADLQSLGIRAEKYESQLVNNAENLKDFE